MESDGNPTHPTFRLNNAPRCRARAKTTNAPCQAPAVRGWSVCRMHGARGGAPTGPANGNWKDGSRSGDVANVRALTSLLGRLTRETVEGIP